MSVTWVGDDGCVSSIVLALATGLLPVSWMPATSSGSVRQRDKCFAVSEGGIEGAVGF